MGLDRRALIVGAGFAAAAPKLVRAEAGSLLHLPGDPLSAVGMLAASKWASNEFSDYPSCRLVFDDGSFYRWQSYTTPFRLARGDRKVPTYAVAVEVLTTDERGKRFITSIPVDGVKLSRKRGNDPEAHVRARWEAAQKAQEFADAAKAQLFPALSGLAGMA